MSLVKPITFAKVVVLFAVALGIGIGLCGLDYLLAANGIGKSTEEFGVGPLDGWSLAVMILSVFGLIITLIAWLISAVVGGFGHKSSVPQRLFNNKDDEDRTK